MMWCRPVGIKSLFKNANKNGPAFILPIAWPRDNIALSKAGNMNENIKAVIIAKKNSL